MKWLITTLMIVLLLTGCAGTQFYFGAGIGTGERDPGDLRVSGTMYKDAPEYRRPVWIELRGY